MLSFVSFSFPALTMDFKRGDWATLGESVVLLVIGFVNRWQILVVINARSSVCQREWLVLLFRSSVILNLLLLFDGMAAFIIVIELMCLLDETFRFNFDMSIATELQSARLLGGLVTAGTVKTRLHGGLHLLCCVALDHIELVLRLASRPLDQGLVVLGSWQALSDFAHAARHSDCFHKVLLIWDQGLDIVQRARDVVQEAWHIQYSVALGSL